MTSDRIYKTRFAHINLIAHDWKKLAAFYERVFECTRILPERNLSGQWLEDSTGISEARISGVHLRLPGYDTTGPTLEIFQYNTHENRQESAVNQPGYAHIAFAVDDVEAILKAVVEAGGGMIGKIVTTHIDGAGTITFVYATDPEGNIIELQKWS